MDLREVRSKYIEYYEKKNHAVIPSASLLPENDATTLFISSGMQPMIPYFLGEPHPQGDKVVNSQKCIRSQDIEEVGDDRHTTFFEMLGNWSFGDYWKKEQLRWVFEFLVKELKINPKKLHVSVYMGDESAGVPKDEESAAIWKELFKEEGIDAEVVENDELGKKEGRIYYYGAKENWWSRVGAPENMPVGEPGGPDSEIFYDFGDGECEEICHPNCDCGRFSEIANSVFMEYKKVGEGRFEALPKKNVDFGGGLERIAAAKNGFRDIFELDIFKKHILKGIEEATDKKYKDNKETMRVIADHLRAATFLILEGVRPDNKLQGYVLRRLIRRSIVKYFELTESSEFESIGEVCISVLEAYGLEENETLVTVVEDEYKKFSKSLEKGMKIIEKTPEDEINAKFAFDLYQTYGFPIEVSQEILAEKGKEISLEDFEKEKESHKELSRTSSAGAFKGGLGDKGEKTVWYHTLTHALHQALREVLGDHVHQAGSNITPERLRFDFTHEKALTDEELEQVEKVVNEQMKRNLEITMETMEKDAALKSGALAFFVEKYGDKVNVYSVGDYSKEICGGPHVENTSEIEGDFKIVKEKSVGSGLRRIRAVVE